jgi:hypothetical protein
MSNSSQATLVGLCMVCVLGCHQSGTAAQPAAAKDGSAGAAVGGAVAVAGSGAGWAGGAAAVDGAVGSGGAAGVPAALVLVDCQTPDAQLLPVVHAGAQLRFLAAPDTVVELGTAQDAQALMPDQWQPERRLALVADAIPAQLKVFARLAEPDCSDAPSFEHVYELRATYPGPPEQPDSTAIPADDPRIMGWATGWVAPVGYGSEVDEAWRLPEHALGPASTDATHVVSLGNGGRITLTFDPPIADGPGFDFVVFENGHSDDFLELAYVEVSSDAEHYVRFDSAYLGQDAVSQYGTHDTSLLEGLAGKYRVGFGGPFDLSLLAYRPRVQAGQVDLAHITHVRLVDVVGDGAAYDSFGHPIYDPHPTVGSGGFDLDAIGVLHAAE